MLVRVRVQPQVLAHLLLGRKDEHVVQTHRAEVHDEIHARSHRSRAADAEQHDLAVGGRGGESAPESRRLIKVAARPYEPVGRLVHVEGALPLTSLLGTLAVKHRHRLARLVISHGGRGGGRARARARGGRRQRIRTLDIVCHVRSALEASSPRLQALEPPPRQRCCLGHLFFRSGCRRLQRLRGHTSARRRQHRGLLAVIERLERLHAGHDGKRPKRRRGPLVHDEDEDRHDHAACDR